ncbi:MAG: heme A synthase [Candidatus Eremiobacteraeota bacterium]|nr:heme A synthase [Candidatus Eremiobacteraeota bacterium]
MASQIKRLMPSSGKALSKAPKSLSAGAAAFTLRVTVKLFRGFAITSAALAFAIAVLGSWVRINDAGLTCPDWPLCHGHVVPALAGGVVLEWSHRLVAFLEGFVVLGVIMTGIRERARIAGLTTALAALIAVFLAQIGLGGATVLLANSPISVMLHWAMGMALLATLTSLAVLAIVAPVPHAMPALRPRFRGSVTPALVLAAAFAFATMCVGAYVSSSYAGLACTTVPACDGTLWGTTAAQFVQMLHRALAGAFALVAFAAVAVIRRHGAGRAGVAAGTGLAFAALQIVLGFANVVLRLPTDMREVHAANAVTVFLCFVIAAVLSTLEPQPATARTRKASLAVRGMASNA